VPLRGDAAVFTVEEFVPPDLPVDRVEIIPPAIDPESPKNMELEADTVRRVLEWIGVEVERPLLAHVSRFDPWKDPLGVIETYRLVREEVPGLQLALVGSMALDDPEGWEVYGEIRTASGGDLDIHVFTNLTGVGNVEANAFQRQADVVIQKSIREGFGLVVSETLWKGTPVVAAKAGGIPLQMAGDAGGFLVDSVEEAADQTLWLLRNPEEGRTLGMRGKDPGSQDWGVRRSGTPPHRAPPRLSRSLPPPHRGRPADLSSDALTSSGRHTKPLRRAAAVGQENDPRSSPQPTPARNVAADTGPRLPALVEVFDSLRIAVPCPPRHRAVRHDHSVLVAASRPDASVRSKRLAPDPSEPRQAATSCRGSGGMLCSSVGAAGGARRHSTLADASEGTGDEARGGDR
jgi:hypothetical protein